ncbi:VOC family protein [Candidatus Lucifugimonas marina]|jgi:catechol 2,3-dioxygenase-like lactoylglutathione lyase family enzyme|uniref:VOC family protein n=1 Tax=Candidatus Lucifugimonas marina TaxID=3038979 RepID=UPI00319E0457
MEFNSLIPELIVSDIERSIHFYRDVLGFTVEYERQEEKFAFLAVENAQLMLLQDNENEHSRTGDLDPPPRGRG